MDISYITFLILIIYISRRCDFTIGDMYGTVSLDIDMCVMYYIFVQMAHGSIKYC